MDIVLITILAVAALVLLVVGLHRHQLSATQSNADSHNPLPPLDDISFARNLPDFDLADEITGISTVEAPEASAETTVIERPGPAEEPLNGVQPGTEESAPPAPARQEREITEITPPPTRVEAPNEEPDSDAGDSQNWLEQVTSLKKEDRLDEALAVCRQVFPLWSAYQQATLIHRARIKQLVKEGDDPREELLTLYKLAAQASFLHDRIKGLPSLSLAQLKTLDLAIVEQLEMPYTRIGYSFLRLIKKTDGKLLQDILGKPKNHLKPREFYADVWQALASTQQNTLF